ncbi:MAG: isoprenylcysteine carboxylmethyltransferase family protein [Terriglobales bacterium]|jgi:protein-S-isoprenylcysteine O-methyltransferase Ste14
MLKSFARAAGFLAYLLITLEMLFMVTPFALYYYSVYSPVLVGSFSLPATGWLPAFFLPHLSTKILPSMGALIVLLGLVGFAVSAFQLYYAKFRRRGVVQSGLYKRIRHPQYLFLGLAGLGLLILWPRFILLIVYINMLWFYYFLARSEEGRMEARYGEAYREQKQRTWMFLPREAGEYLQKHLFGWIYPWRARLFVIYLVSLAVTINVAFGLRETSLALTTHIILPKQKIAAVSFLSENEEQLRDLIQSAEGAEEAQDRIKAEDTWILVQAMEGKRPVVHIMIDAGMMRRKAEDLNLAKQGVKLVFLRSKGGLAQDQPFSPWVRWQPVLVVEMNDGKVSQVQSLDRGLFVGNPAMPVF